MSDSTDQLTNLTSSKSKDNNEEPVSRFWACFFSCSIFALLWTQKMNKTVKWIPVFILFVAIWYVIDNILYPIPLEINTASSLIDFFFFYPESNMKPLEILVDDIILIVVDMKLMPTSYSKELVSILSYTIIVFYNLVAYFGSILLMIYLMFKWTTLYNIKHFGYKSKKEWKKTINSKYNTQQTMKKELKIIGNEIVGGIIKTTSKLKPQTKTGDDEIIAKINKWHKLMEKGIISESEFESKKSKLLDKSQKSNI